ncbi:hypothetical protein [Stakelama marina]|uniref:Uncharacterized protein n=1 Tax=Stakelama marina TaxID=2826939 RepID=A0A8T4ICC2_9SPHN|nr:hypothetical protein [Stakelama marina]MBR0551494.1 hypothetical protein [Stakelama marina]
MSEQGTERAVLDYFNSSREDENPFRSLTTLFENVAGQSVPYADSYDVEDEVYSKEALRVILDQMVSDGLLETKMGERDYEASYCLTDQGVYEASGFDQLAVGTPANSLVTEDGVPIVTESGDFIIVGDVPEADIRHAAITVNSAEWTGLTKTIVDARNARVVSSLINKALDSLPGAHADNFKTMQAAAYLKAARELVDAPEPPSEEIWRLISRAADIIGLAGLFFTIFSQAFK